MTTLTMVETIGERLRRLRVERGLSQRELACEGVSYAYISRIEAGTRQPSVKAIRRIAAQLGVSAAYLETGEESPLERLLVELEESLLSQYLDERYVHGYRDAIRGVRDAAARP